LSIAKRLSIYEGKRIRPMNEIKRHTLAVLAALLLGPLWGDGKAIRDGAEPGAPGKKNRRGNARVK
jgi:hypothetical protein